MDKQKILEILNDLENKSNKDLFAAMEELEKEFINTKELIISLTKHLDALTELYKKANKELDKRKK